MNTNKNFKFGGFNVNYLKLTPEKLAEWRNNRDRSVYDDSSLLLRSFKKESTNKPNFFPVKDKQSYDNDCDDDSNVFDTSITNNYNKDAFDPGIINDGISNDYIYSSNDDNLSEEFGNYESEIQKFSGDDDSSDLNYYF